MSDLRQHLIEEHGAAVAAELQTPEALRLLHEAFHAISDPHPDHIRDASPNSL